MDDEPQIKIDAEEFNRQLRLAWIDGATAVHEEWKREGGEAPRGDPEFGEAAYDYVGSLSAFVADDRDIDLVSDTARAENERWHDRSTDREQAVQNLQDNRIASGRDPKDITIGEVENELLRMKGKDECPMYERDYNEGWR